ncbi:hypothetical protein LCGC14_2303090, partial [marine sediment metagenome]
VDTGWKATSRPMLEFYNSNAQFGGGRSLARIYGEIGNLGENSKLYFAVADSSKNLQDRTVIDKDGNVGINTTTPASKLSINGGLHVGGDSDAGDNNLLVDGTVGCGVITQSGTTLANTYQPLDAELTSLAALSYVAASFVKMTGANTFALRTIGETADDLEGTIDHDSLANTHGAIQPLDSGLTSLAGLTYVSDSFIKVTAEDTYAIRTIGETKTDLSLNNVSNVATDDTAYDATSWNTNADATTKNAIRDKIETMGTAIGLNTPKVTNATHTGEVTGATALTIADNIVDEANLKLDTGPTNDYVLTADSTKSGGMKWAALAGGFQTQGDVLDDLNTLGVVGADSEFLVGTGAGALAWESGATARTSLDLGTGDSPQFTALILTDLPTSISIDELDYMEYASDVLAQAAYVPSGFHSVTFKTTAQLDIAIKKWGTAALLLDGNSDYLEIADSADWDIFADNTENWTVDFWVYRDSGTNPGDFNSLLGQQKNTDNFWDIHIDDHVNEYIGLISNSGGVSKVNIVTTTTVTADTWVHIALVKVADDYALYVDGVRAGTAINDTDQFTYAAPLFIGGRG